MTDGPYKLPEGWRWVRLGKVCQYKRRSIEPERYPEQMFYLYSMPAYDREQKPEKVAGKQIKSSKLLLEPPVCLFSKLNPRIPRIWVVAEWPKDGVLVASTEFMPLRIRFDVLDPFYLGSVLGAEVFLSQVSSNVTGATGSRQRLKPEVVLTALIPLPPLAEQRRIVARVEELTARVREAKRLREEAREEAERLWQSVLADTFPRPGAELPPGWRWVRLGEVVKASFSGGTPSTKVDAYWDGDIPWTTSASVAEEDIFLEKYLRTITREGLENSASRIAPAGSLIVATRVGVGKAVVATFNVAISQDLTALILREDVNPVFSAYLFKSPTVQAQLLTRTRGTTIKGVTRRELLSALIPLPPLAEQRRIVARLEAFRERLQALEKAQEETEAHLKELERSILDKAFRGEL